MKFGLLSGCLWGLDTVIMSIALAGAAFTDTAEALALAGIVSAAFHDTFCAIWMAIYMALKHRLKDTWKALKTRSGKIIVLSALLGGPVGMTGYILAIQNVGPGMTAIISSFYPAFGTLLAALILKEKITGRQLIALAVAMGAIIVMGAAAVSGGDPGNAVFGVIAALVCLVGWGSEAVISGYGMKDDRVDNETALQIRETTSAVVYLVIILPMFAAWGFALSVVPTKETAILALAALAGVASYLFYYKAIASPVGAAKSMAANISYSAWSVIFGLILLGTIPSVLEVVCCILIFAGTILASCNWSELFGRARSSS